MRSIKNPSQPEVQNIPQSRPYFGKQEPHFSEGGPFGRPHAPGENADPSGTTPGGFQLEKDGTRHDENADQIIKSDIEERLKMHIELNSQQIHVDVNRGQVVLAGTVADSYAKRIVGDIASQVVDMSAVRNELEFNDSVPVDIEPASTNEAPDPEATE